MGKTLRFCLFKTSYVIRSVLAPQSRNGKAIFVQNNRRSCTSGGNKKVRDYRCKNVISTKLFSFFTQLNLRSSLALSLSVQIKNLPDAILVEKKKNFLCIVDKVMCVFAERRNCKIKQILNESGVGGGR